MVFYSALPKLYPKCSAAFRLGRCIRNASHVAHLYNRSLIRLQGKDAGGFLQQILTCDMQLLCSSTNGESFENTKSDPSMGSHMNVGQAKNFANSSDQRKKSLPAFLLNEKGRILYDLIVYKVDTNEEVTGEFLIECDSSVMDSLLKRLKLYRLRKSVDIRPCGNLSVHAFWMEHQGTFQQDLGASDIAIDKLTSSEILTPDPRLQTLGYRALLLPETAERKMHWQTADLSQYEDWRYRIGIAEGINELPSEQALPLESNADYLEAVSFSKGCYIGQELTARTYHTGEIRKRLMPVKVVEASLLHPERFIWPDRGADNQLTLANSEQQVGFLRALSVFGNGLALLRVSHVLPTSHSVEPLLLQWKRCDGSICLLQATVPFWWPKAASRL